jgi:hypothetical protein
MMVRRGDNSSYIEQQILNRTEKGKRKRTGKKPTRQKKIGNTAQAKANRQKKIGNTAQNAGKNLGLLFPEDKRKSSVPLSTDPRFSRSVSSPLCHASHSHSLGHGRRRKTTQAHKPSLNPLT